MRTPTPGKPTPSCEPADPDPARRRGTLSPSRSQGLVARLLGIALGGVLAVHVFPGLQVDSGPPSLPLAVSVSVVRSGEVGLVDGGQLLAEADVRSGDDGTARGRLDLASETSVPIELSVHDIGSPIGLEDQLWLRVTLGDALVFEGTQARLRQSSSRSLTISPGATVPIDVTVGLLPGADARAAGRRTELRLQIVSPAAGAAVAASS
jgi:hypothetical protein